MRSNEYAVALDKEQNKNDGRDYKSIPLMTPYVTTSMKAAVAAVLNTRWIGQGPKVEEFEHIFSEQVVLGRAAVAVGSGTDALHLAYILAGIKPGDEVIAPVFTCTATNIPLLHIGATIRLCDVAPGTLNMDVEHARSMVNEKTRAIVGVHYGGIPANESLARLGVPYIEDAAQALGGRRVGLIGNFACFSFQAVKHVTTGDGGMLVLDHELAAKAKRLRWFGIDREAKLRGTWENDIKEAGFKYQMTDIGAAMGISGLDGLEFQLKRRREFRDRYVEKFGAIDGIKFLDTDPGSACWLGTVLVDRREDFRRKLLDAGIESDQVHYRNDRYSIFKEFAGRDPLPNMNSIDGKYLCIPLHMGMTMEDCEHICEVIGTGW